MEEINNIDLFQDYLLGNLNSAEIEVFEARLKEDIAFKDGFNEFKLLEKGIEEAIARKEVKLELRKKFNRDIKVNKYIESVKRGDTTLILQKKKTRIRRLSIAASVLLIATFSFVFWPTKNIDKPLATFLDTDGIPRLGKNLSCDELIKMEKNALSDLDKADKELTLKIQKKISDSTNFLALQKLRNNKRIFLKNVKEMRIKQCASDSTTLFNVEKGFIIDSDMLKDY